MDKPKIETKKTKKLIIVAEDDLYYANIYKVKLAKEGYEPIVVGNGEWALKFARERKPDLVILDLVMPVKDGFETLKEMRKDENLKYVKVLVLSSLGQEEDIKRAKELGADGYLVKTDIAIADLMKKIKEQIG